MKAGNGARSRNGSHPAPAPSELATGGARKFWLAGATGFLGSHLTRLLVERGHEVTAVARGGGSVGDTTVASLDVCDVAGVSESARGAHGAFLCVGKVSRDPAAAEELHRANVLATRQALAGLRAAGVRRVVVASTSGTIAVSEGPNHVADEESSAPSALILGLPYYRSKLYAEREALQANDPPDFEVVIVNPSLLLGPGDLRESSTGDVRKFLEREVVASPRGGLAFVDVRDAAEGMWLAFDRGRPGERYLLNAQNITVAAFFQRLSRLTGLPAPRVSLPRSRTLAVGLTDVFSRAVRAMGGEPPVDRASIELAQLHWYCRSDKAERELGFSARDPGETLRDTVCDLVDRGVVARPASFGIAL